MKKVLYLLYLAVSICTFPITAQEPDHYDASLIHKSWPPLHKAIAKKEFDLAAAIVKADSKQVRQFGKGPVNVYETYKILAIFKENLSSDYTALELAILYHAPKHFIQQLIELGTDVSVNRAVVLSKDRVEVRTPLYAAISEKNAQAFKLLIDAEANTKQVLRKAEYHGIGKTNLMNWNNTQYNYEFERPSMPH